VPELALQQPGLRAGEWAQEQQVGLTVVAEELVDEITERRKFIRLEVEVDDQVGLSVDPDEGLAWADHWSTSVTTLGGLAGLRSLQRRGLHPGWWRLL
jgi:hypothetical protein